MEDARQRHQFWECSRPEIEGSLCAYISEIHSFCFPGMGESRFPISMLCQKRKGSNLPNQRSIRVWQRTQWWAYCGGNSPNLFAPLWQLCLIIVVKWLPEICPPIEMHWENNSKEKKSRNAIASLKPKEPILSIATQGATGDSVRPHPEPSEHTQSALGKTWGGLAILAGYPLQSCFFFCYTFNPNPRHVGHPLNVSWMAGDVLSATPI